MFTCYTNNFIFIRDVQSTNASLQIQTVTSNASFLLSFLSRIECLFLQWDPCLLSLQLQLEYLDIKRLQMNINITHYIIRFDRFLICAIDTHSSKTKHFITLMFPDCVNLLFFSYYFLSLNDNFTSTHSS